MGPEYSPHVGGSILNTSITLGRLGLSSYYFGTVSNDKYVGLIERYLKESKVRDEFIIKTIIGQLHLLLPI